MTTKVTCYQYWDKGYSKMPLMLQTIYNHNMAIAKKYGFTLLLLSDDTVSNYFSVPSRFLKLPPNFRSDIVRFHMLHLYGGIWIDTDGLLLGDLNRLWASFQSSDKLAILEVELKDKIGSATIVMKQNTEVSAFCYNHVLNVLNTVPPETSFKWDWLGPTTVSLLYKAMKDKVILRNEEFVKRGSNFITWANNPGIKKDDWLLSDSPKAKELATKLLDNTDCFYALTWTIYSRNDVSDPAALNNLVFKNDRSVWTHLVKESLARPIGKNAHKLKCFFYSPDGISTMTALQQRIYTYNKSIGVANDFEVILLTDATISTYVEIPTFEGYDEVQKKKVEVQSFAMMPFYILHKWGGFFFPLDTFLMKGLPNVWTAFVASGYLLHIESCDQAKFLCMIPNTMVSSLCILCINSMMNAHRITDIISWDFLNAYTLQMVQDTYPSKVRRSVRMSNSIRRLDSENQAYMASKDVEAEGYVYLQGSNTLNAKDVATLWSDERSIVFWLALQSAGLS
jgi:hypothetical protein